MDTPQPIPSFDESVAQVMQTLPPVIRAYLTEGKYTTVAKDLMTKYSLRIDQGGVLEREIMLLLMGVESPEEFTQALTTEANLNKQTIDGIVQDINTQIFVPIRQEMMKSGVGNTPQPPKPTPPIIEPPKGIYAPPLQSPRYFHLENKLAAPRSVTPQPLRPQAPLAAAATQRDLFPPPPRPATAVSRPMGAQPPVTISNAEPKPNIVPQPSFTPPSLKATESAVAKPVSTIAPLPPKIVLPRPSVASGVGGPRPMLPLGESTPAARPTVSFPPRPLAPPPANLPGAMTAPDIIPQSRPASALPAVSTAPPKPYSSDPYREPIEP